MEFFNPRVDIIFKKVFGVEENKDLLISLINSIVSEEDQVSDLEILNPYNIQTFKNDKLSILDIKARNKETGELFGIEIQVSADTHYPGRALFYWSKMYVEQLSSGINYNTLKKVIGIHILNFITINSSKQYHNVFVIKEQQSNERHFEHFELHTIELTKFEPDSDFFKKLSKIKKKLDLWVAFLAKYEILSNKVSTDMPELKKAVGIVEHMNLDKEERDEYEGHLKWLRMEAGALEKKFGEGLEEGIQKGLEEGLKKARDEKLKIVENMLSQGISVDIIANVTGLSMKEIDRLKNRKFCQK